PSSADTRAASSGRRVRRTGGSGGATAAKAPRALMRRARVARERMAKYLGSEVDVPEDDVAGIGANGASHPVRGEGEAEGRADVPVVAAHLAVGAAVPKDDAAVLAGQREEAAVGRVSQVGRTSFGSPWENGNPRKAPRGSPRSPTRRWL